MAPVCRIVSSDYLDKDVFLNIRCFYAAAGYRIGGPTAAADLLVVLRGDNGTEQRGFAGVIHIYDYVKEYRVDWSQRYPHAARILVITLTPRQRSRATPDEDPAARHDARIADGDPSGAGFRASRATTTSAAAIPAQAPEPLPDPQAARIVEINAYLPVIPALWCERWRHKRPQPLHLSNYKRMAGDAYQQDLLQLIRAGAVEVHGARWELVGITAHPLSYRQANRRLAQSACCFGLMWPYQRGLTLSGRMWQAPLNGCFVISETGSDILGCPGVLERERFDADSASQAFSTERCLALQQEARRFWEKHTDALALALGFGPGLRPDRALIRRHRRQLLLWDLAFRQARAQERLRGELAGLRSRLGRLARRLGMHPRQLGRRR